MSASALILSRPRWRFAYFAAMGKVGRRPQLILSRPRWRFAYFAAMGKVGRRPHCARRRVSERNRRASGGS